MTATPAELQALTERCQRAEATVARVRLVLNGIRIALLRPRHQDDPAMHYARMVLRHWRAALATALDPNPQPTHPPHP